jgi:hypothetical protein
MSRDKQDKLTYQAPVVMPLGELAKGEGRACKTGGSASVCSIGITAANNCRVGRTAGNRCGPGGTAGTKCFGGSTPNQ